MIRTAVDRVFSVLQTNFNTDFASIATAAGVAAVTADFYKRQSAERFANKTSVGIGVYQVGGSTSRRKPGAAPGAGIRDTTVDVMVDWYIRGSDDELVAQQTEIAVEAILRSVDRMPDAVVWFAADGSANVTWDIERAALVDDGGIIEERALVRFPVIVRETGL